MLYLFTLFAEIISFSLKTDQIASTESLKPTFDLKKNCINGPD